MVDLGGYPHRGQSERSLIRGESIPRSCRPGTGSAPWLGSPSHTLPATLLIVEELSHLLNNRYLCLYYIVCLLHDSPRCYVFAFRPSMRCGRRRRNTIMARLSFGFLRSCAWCTSLCIRHRNHNRCNAYGIILECTLYQRWYTHRTYETER